MRLQPLMQSGIQRAARIGEHHLISQSESGPLTLGEWAAFVVMQMVDFFLRNSRFQRVRTVALVAEPAAVGGGQTQPHQFLDHPFYAPAAEQPRIELAIPVV